MIVTIFDGLGLDNRLSYRYVPVMVPRRTTRHINGDPSEVITTFLLLFSISNFSFFRFLISSLSSNSRLADNEYRFRFSSSDSDYISGKIELCWWNPTPDSFSWIRLPRKSVLSSSFFISKGFISFRLSLPASIFCPVV